MKPITINVTMRQNKASQQRADSTHSRKTGETNQTQWDCEDDRLAKSVFDTIDFEQSRNH